MFIAAQFTIAKIWKQSKCPSGDEWMKKLWDIYTVEYYAAVKKKDLLPFETPWRDLKSIMLGCALGGPESASCFNNVWTEQTQGCPSSSLRPLSCFSSSHHLQNHLQDQPTHQCVFYLNSLLLNSHELPNSTIIPPRWRLQSTAWPTCICRPDTYLSLGFCFPREDVALEGELVEKKREGAELLLLKLQKARWPHSLPGPAEASPRSSL